MPCYKGYCCHMQVHTFRNYIPAVISSPNYTSLPFMVATFLATCLTVVLQLSKYSIFHSRDTPIWLGLPWWSYFCQCLNTETSTQSNRDFNTETLSIFYSRKSYIRLGVTLWFASLIINKDNSYWTQSLVFNSDTPNQHSLPSQTSSYHLKLQPHSRQTAQHISWS